MQIEQDRGLGPEYKPESWEVQRILESQITLREVYEGPQFRDKAEVWYFYDFEII